MKERIKKTCEGCRAFDGPFDSCSLGYWKDRYEPKEPCPKPKTYDKLVELHKKGKVNP